MSTKQFITALVVVIFIILFLYGLCYTQIDGAGKDYDITTNPTVSAPTVTPQVEGALEPGNEDLQTPAEAVCVQTALIDYIIPLEVEEIPLEYPIIDLLE